MNSVREFMSVPHCGGVEGRPTGTREKAGAPRKERIAGEAMQGGREPNGGKVSSRGW